ncbi:MAG TPA: VanW family protein [Caulobacteraceae bacterium]|nr:VanW family protein [Caulobacteraceae bacterium]
MALSEAKSSVFRLRRTLSEAGRAPPRLARLDDARAFKAPLAASRTPLWSETAPGEQALQLGKVHNLRRAAMSLDGVLIPAGSVFSFWRQLGRATRARGYVGGRMLREGCMIPALGGGLCQLSNALYDVALQADCTILERHPHSRIVPGSAAAAGRDATVAWNYVDLRFTSARDLLLSVTLDRDDLVVGLAAREGAGALPPTPFDALADARIAARSCATCGETDCHLHERLPAAPAATLTRRALLVDEDWPEFRAFVAASAEPGDVIGVPLDGARWGLRRYRWDTHGFASVAQAPLAALDRSLTWRRTPAEGPLRRAAEARTSAAIARALARQLGPEVVELCVAQSLLPELWRGGWLGGRRFSVMMTRLPIAVLQARLDAAVAAHPERKSLGDYRAPAALAEAEAAALAAAERIVTPHAEIAALFAERALKLVWARPPAPAHIAPPSGIVAFPGPTIARKGAYELREAARALDLVVRPLGSMLEGAGFWKGVRLEPTPAGGHWLDGVALVAHPALTQDAPRRLLEALAAGIPVVATPACGLEPEPGLILVPPGDAGLLADCLRSQLAPG